jgi:eukaryotic-like serine/threonine-protein kinase
VSAGDPTVSPVDATTPAEGQAVQTRDELVRGTKVGRYEIVRLVGRGGMGAVYAAYDPQLDRQVAVKLLHTGVRTASLIDEAKALARLDDPHVVQVFDAGEHEGEAFVAMQLVLGEDLGSALERRKPSPPEILAWFVAAGRGLAAAHAAGIIHRDFKPGNVLIDRRGRVAVTDFGLAQSTQTPGASFAGTPLYMAPEQHALGSATAASDQWAFCVALWEALFGHHPYLGPEGASSPFEVGYKVTENPLAPPPRTRGIPRRVVDALSRGLAKDPKDRWPSMEALLAVLAPREHRRSWPVIVAALASAAIAGAGIWFFLERDQVASCDTRAGRSLLATWSPTHAMVQQAAFVKSGLVRALDAAGDARRSLDKYASRWSELSTATCAAETTSAGSDLLVKKRACLDGALDRMRAVADVLDSGTEQVVEHVPDVLATLPELRDCADPKLVIAGPAAPPPALAPLVIRLGAEIDRVMAEQAIGSTHTLDTARALLARASALGWPPTIARAHIALGAALAVAYQPAFDELVRGAELAIAAHLDRDAIKAWDRAFAEAAYENKPDLIGMLVTEARSTAERIGDPALALEAEVSYARALIQTQHWDEGLSICRPAIATALNLGAAWLADLARDCMFEGLQPAGKTQELHEVATERIASAAKRFGPNAPAIGVYEEILADADAQVGNFAAARPEIDRAVDVMTKAFPEHDNIKIAEVLRVRASVEAGEGKANAALATLREGRDVALAVHPRQAIVLADLDTAIANILAQRGDLAGALKMFDEAIAALRAQNAHTVPLAIALLNYGMIVGGKDFDAGVRALGEARQIFEQLHDPRSAYAATVLCSIDADHHRWRDALAPAEEALAFAAHDPGAVPENTAQVQFVLARALVETGGDRKRALDLARTARATFAGLGPSAASSTRQIDVWLAKHR